MSIADYTVPDAVLPFLVILAGVAHALLQEQLMLAMSSKLPLLITMFEFGVCSGHSGVWLALFGKKGVRPPKLPLLRISMLVFASLVSGNVALRYVSYPVKVCALSAKVAQPLAQASISRDLSRRAIAVEPCPSLCPQVIIKSCKLLPTMVLGSSVIGKTYSAADHLAAALLCLGLVGFTLASHDSEGGASSSIWSSSPLGVGLLFFAVCCDAVQVLLQEKLMRADAQLTPMHVMLHTNGMAFFAVASGFVITGEAQRLPVGGAPLLDLYLYGFSSWVGVCCFIALTRTWGGTAAVVTTNSRKLLTIIFSFVFFPKPLGSGLFFSGVTVMSGIALHAYSRASKPKQIDTGSKAATKAI